MNKNFPPITGTGATPATHFPEEVRGPYDFGNLWSVKAVVERGRVVRADGKPRWQEALRRRTNQAAAELAAELRGRMK